MRYSARKRNIQWRDDDVTRAARLFLTEVLAEKAHLVFAGETLPISLINTLINSVYLAFVRRRFLSLVQDSLQPFQRGCRGRGIVPKNEIASTW